MFTTIISALFLITGIVLLIVGVKAKRSTKVTAEEQARARVEAELEAAGAKPPWSQRHTPNIPRTSELRVGPLGIRMVSSAFYIAGGVSIVLALVFISTGIFTQVNAKNAGVLITFGKVADRTLSPGLHTKMPWQKVIEIDGTVQTDKYDGDSCMKVRIGDGSEACVSITNRWNVVETEANKVYENFKSNDPTQEFRTSMMDSQLRASVQLALQNYNPIADFEEAGKAAGSVELSFTPDFNEVNAVIMEDMRKKLKELANGGEALGEIQSITMSAMSLAPSTQDKLNEFVGAIGDTRIAEQKKQTAAAQAAANRELSDSVANDPNVLVSKCLDTLEDASESGYQLPAGFSCWPGGGGGVVIPGTR